MIAFTWQLPEFTIQSVEHKWPPPVPKMAGFNTP